MRRCTVSLLGGFEVRVDGSPVPVDAWRSRRAADLVKLLALEATHQLHREQVMDLLWPELGIEAAGANLRKAVHCARRAMGAEEAIRSTGGMLALWGGGVEVAARRFLAAADAALANGDEEGCGVAADLYTGEPVPADRVRSLGRRASCPPEGAPPRRAQGRPAVDQSPRPRPDGRGVSP